MKFAISALLLLGSTAVLGAPAPVQEEASHDVRASVLTTSSSSSDHDRLDRLLPAREQIVKPLNSLIEPTTSTKHPSHPDHAPVIMILTRDGPTRLSSANLESHRTRRGDADGLSRRHVDTFLAIMKGIWNLAFPLNQMVHIPQFDELDKEDAEQQYQQTDPSGTPTQIIADALHMHVDPSIDPLH